MSRRRALAALALLLAAVAAALWLRRSDGALHYTGFVEGEERVLRSEVSGRVLEVLFAEGDVVPGRAVVARLDDSEVASRIRTKQRELAVLEAQIRRQQEQVALSDATWQRDVAAREAALREAEARAVLAARTLERQQNLFSTGVASPQALDEASAQRDATASAVKQARDLLARTRAEEGNIALARRQLDVLSEQLEWTRAQQGELEVLRDKHALRAPDAETRVQSQLLWPGELAQPGTAILSVLDPRDKYVQIYVPVPDLAQVRVGRRVEIELDSEPGRRVPGEVSFIADEANFTPEKIETRSDRLGQVYRAKVRILEGVERFQPGTEGDVTLSEEDAEPPAARTARGSP
jgi:multidrug resistance efflux pump